MMRIGYFGDGPWAHKAFRKLNDDKTIEIAFVSVRYDKRDPVLLSLAEEYHIPTEIHQDINSDEFVNRMKTYHVDLFVSMSFNQIFKNRMIHLPEQKTINCHAGNLPFYRGRNILNWVLMNDEKAFGITVHYVDEGTDTGRIIAQKAVEVLESDTPVSLQRRVMEQAEWVILPMAIDRIAAEHTEDSVHKKREGCK